MTRQQGTSPTDAAQGLKALSGDSIPSGNRPSLVERHAQIRAQLEANANSGQPGGFREWLLYRAKRGLVASIGVLIAALIIAVTSGAPDDGQRTASFSYIYVLMFTGATGAILFGILLTRSPTTTDSTNRSSD